MKSFLQNTKASPQFNMGKIINGDRSEFLLQEDHLSVHSCVLGQSGSGKSKYLELLMRHLMASQKSFSLIDPHGDLSEDLLAFAMYRKVVKNDDRLLNRIHYLEPSYEQVFNYDPFKFRPMEPIPDHLQESAYRAWLHTKVQAVGEILQRKQNQMGFEGMPRLERVLTDVLTGVGMAVRKNGPEKGNHLPLADALVLLDVFHPRHMQVYNHVAPHLPSYIKSDFTRWHQMMKRNPDAIMRDVESTLNRLRSFLSPVVKGIFCDHMNSLDFFSIIQNGEILLVNLRRTNYFSADQRNAIGGLFIHELLSTAENTPRHMRKNHYLIVDEAAEFIGGDIGHALGVMRKFEMPIVLAAQDLSSFKKGELDLRPKILSQCGTIVSFKQTWPEDVDILVRVMATGNLQFKKHYQIVDRPDGYEFLPMDTYSENFTWGENWSNGFSVSQSRTDSEQLNISIAQQKGRTLAIARGEAVQKVEIEGPTHDSHTRGLTKNDSTTSTQNEALTTTKAEGSGTAIQNGSQRSKEAGGNRGLGLTINHGMQMIPRTREELHESPSLQDQVNDQFEKLKQVLHSLIGRCALAKLRDDSRAFVFETAFVDEKWLETHKWSVIASVKKVLQRRPYFVIPQVGEEAEEKRISDFLQQPNTSSAKPNGIQPGRRTNPIVDPTEGEKIPFAE